MQYSVNCSWIREVRSTLMLHSRCFIAVSQVCPDWAAIDVFRRPSNPLWSSKDGPKLSSIRPQMSIRAFGLRAFGLLSRWYTELNLKQMKMPLIIYIFSHQIQRIPRHSSLFEELNYSIRHTEQLECRARSRCWKPVGCSAERHSGRAVPVSVADLSPAFCIVT